MNTRGKNWYRNVALNLKRIIKDCYRGSCNTNRALERACNEIQDRGWLIAHLQRRLRHWKRKSAAQHRTIKDLRGKLEKAEGSDVLRRAAREQQKKVPA